MIAIFGCTANPFAMHHVKMVQVLLQTFSRVIIIICGPRPDKESANDILPVHRAAMTDMSLKFLNDPRVSVEYFDLENGTFTRTHKLQEMFAHLGELWHVIGADWVKGGKDGQSKIQREWMHGGEVWQSLNFAVMTRPGHDLVPQDLPPRAKVFHLSESGSSTGIRERVPRHESISGLVVPAVAEYISRYDLYSGRPARNKTNLKLRDLRFKLFWDPRRKEAIAAAEKMRPWEDEDNPNLALVFGGDRTMLHAARKDWPLRIPFFGVNYGRVGYNLDNIRNEFRPEMLLEQELEIYHCPMLYVEMETITRERCSTFGQRSHVAQSPTQRKT